MQSGRQDESIGDSARLLGVSKLVKAYGKRVALNGIDLQLAAGEFVALLGPNGAGKSTLFQLLSGLFLADRGHLEVMGRDYRDGIVPVLARIGVVFQQPTLDLDLSVRANLRFHARLHGLSGSAARSRIAEEIARLGLDEYADEPSRNLSGGNRRKVELARALLHRPNLLLMDEATVGLDPASRRQLLDYVMSLRGERGVGVLWATHLVDEAETADRVVILHKGEVLYDAAPQSLCQSAQVQSLAELFLQSTGIAAEAS